MKTKLSFLVLSVLFAFSACMNEGGQQTTAVAPSPEEVNKKAYREIARSFETGNVDSLGNYVTENSVNHGDPMPGITSAGLQQLKDMIAMYKTSFPDMKFSFHHVAAEGDLVMAHGTWTGTNSGPFMGGPSTGKSVSGEFVDVLRFENGKAVEHWEVSDNLPFMIQMGFVPAMPNAPAPVQHPSHNWDATVANDSASNAREEKLKESYRAVMAMVESGDLTNLDQYIAADFKENIAIPGVTLPDGIEGARQAMTMLKQMYPDMKNTINHIVAEGDVLIANTTMEGTFAGGIPGFPAEATGKKVKVDIVDIVQFNAEGKGQAHWDVADHYKELVQLGVLPDPQAAATGDAQSSAK